MRKRFRMIETSIEKLKKLSIFYVKKNVFAAKIIISHLSMELKFRAHIKCYLKQER